MAGGVIGARVGVRVAGRWHDATLERVIEPPAGGRLRGEAEPVVFARAIRGPGRRAASRIVRLSVVANITGSFQMSTQWKVSTKMTYLGGRPYTPVDLALSAQQRRAVYDLSRVNAERAPDYFRLDLRLDRTFRLGDRVATIFAGAQNVTNRRNFAGYGWDRQ